MFTLLFWVNWTLLVQNLMQNVGLFKVNDTSLTSSKQSSTFIIELQPYATCVTMLAEGV